MLQSCELGRLSHEVGWKYQTVVATLEARRKVKSSHYYKRQIATKVSAGNVQIKFTSTSYDVALKSMPQNTFDDNLT